MKKIILALSCAGLLISANSFAGGAAYHSSQAGANSVQAVGHSAAAGAKSVAAVASVPLIVIGKAGDLSGKAGDYLYEQANTPLSVSDETLSVSDKAGKQAQNLVSPDNIIL